MKCNNCGAPKTKSPDNQCQFCGTIVNNSKTNCGTNSKIKGDDNRVG